MDHVKVLEVDHLQQEEVTMVALGQPKNQNIIALITHSQKPNGHHVSLKSKVMSLIG